MEQQLDTTSFPLSEDLQKKIKTFREDWYKRYKKISKETTPEVDGTGRKIIDTRPDGYDFIIEAYMRDCLDRHFPGWSWDIAAPLHFLGAEWVIAQGTLSIVDESLIAFGVTPPLRHFYASNGVRIKYKRNKPHDVDNIVDVGNDCASANSKAFKKAINQLTHIGDDVYGKRIDEENAGTLETLLEVKGDQASFVALVTEHKLQWGKIFEVLGVKSIAEIEDYVDAFKKIKEVML